MNIFASDVVLIALPCRNIAVHVSPAFINNTAMVYDQSRPNNNTSGMQKTDLNSRHVTSQ